MIEVKVDDRQVLEALRKLERKVGNLELALRKSGRTGWSGREPMRRTDATSTKTSETIRPCLGVYPMIEVS